MLSEYHLYVNGRVYSGESAAQETAPARPFSGGWSGKVPATRDVLVFDATPRRLVGTANLTSALKRILDRMGDGTLGTVEKIEIRRINQD